MTNKAPKTALLLAAGIAGIFCTPRSANASEFLWIAGANFSYAAAACATPTSSFYAWFLAAGPGATTAAYTGCTGGGGTSGSFAFAQAGTGGAGAAFALGFADPYAGIGIGTDLGSGDLSNSGNYQTDSTSGATELDGSPGYSLGTNGLTFNNAAETDLNGVDEFAAYLYNGPDENLGTLCEDLTQSASGCSGSQSASLGDVTDLGTLTSDLPLTLLGSMNDPGSLDSSELIFNETLTSDQLPDVILVAEGDAASAPEPGTLLLLGVGLAAVDVYRRKRA